jgi:hypothetical protein
VKGITNLLYERWAALLRQIEVTGYVTDLITDQALDCLDRRCGRTTTCAGWRGEVLVEVAAAYPALDPR